MDCNHGHGLFMVCSWSVRGLLKVCSWSVEARNLDLGRVTLRPFPSKPVLQDVFHHRISSNTGTIVKFVCVDKLFLVCSWSVCGLFKVCSWSVEARNLDLGRVTLRPFPSNTGAPSRISPPN